MNFKIYYFIFIICASVFSLQSYGLPLTLRQLSAVIMFFVCFWTEKKLWIDKIIALYMVFVFFFGLSSINDGNFALFLLRLVGDYFVAYVALWSIRILAIRYNGLNVLFYTLIVLGLVDGAVTFCQFIGWDFLNPIINRLGLLSYDRYHDYQGEAMLLRSAPGIFSHPTLNAHVLIPCTLFSVIVLMKNKIMGIVITGLMVIFMFSTQQRTAFGMVLLSLIFIIIYYTKASKYSVLFPIVALVIFWGITELFQLIQSGNFRFSELGLDATGREDIYKNATSFISLNPMGGIYSYLKLNESYPHNLIYGALIYAGWIGGGFLIFIVLLQLKECYRSFSEKPQILEMVLMLSVISMLANGFTHNQSIVNGEIMTWTVWGAFYYLRKKNVLSKKLRR